MLVPLQLRCEGCFTGEVLQDVLNWKVVTTLWATSYVKGKVKIGLASLVGKCGEDVIKPRGDGFLHPRHPLLKLVYQSCPFSGPRRPRFFGRRNQTCRELKRAGQNQMRQRAQVAGKGFTPQPCGLVEEWSRHLQTGPAPLARVACVALAEIHSSGVRRCRSCHSHCHAASLRRFRTSVTMLSGGFTSASPLRNSSETCSWVSAR